MNWNSNPEAMSTIAAFVDRDYDDLITTHFSKPSELAFRLCTRGNKPEDVEKWQLHVIDTVSAVMEDYEFLAYLKGKIMELQLEWTNKDTVETASAFLYYYYLLFEELADKCNVNNVNTDIKTRKLMAEYVRNDAQSVQNMFFDGTEFYYDKENNKWVMCDSSGDLIPIYDNWGNVKND